MSKLTSIIFESKDIFSYEDGSPDINTLLPNDTGRRIIKTEYCMIDYDEKGALLRLRCNYPYSSAESNDENHQGGWPDHIPKTENGEAAQVVYSLFHLKQIVYEDGTVWNNPDYEDWFKVHAVKEIDIDEL